MADSIVLYVFKDSEIRFVGTSEAPEWVAADILAVLYPDAARSSYPSRLRRIPAGWKGMTSDHTLGGNQGMTTVLEPGLYALIARSQSPLAVPFQKWLFEEVLPSIRKTGGYGQVDQKTLPVPTVADQMGMIESAFKFFQLDNSPRHLQLARDHVANLLGAQPALPGSVELPWQGVAEIAEALGYKAYDVVTARSPLGRTVAQWSRDELGEEPNIEERIVGGRACKLKVYKRSEDLEAVIHDFMQTRGFNNLSAVS